MSSKFELAAEGDIGGSAKRYQLEQMKDTHCAKITTNYEISRKELDTISKIAGIDSFEHPSRYVVKVAIGELFDPANVIRALEQTMDKLMHSRPGRVTPTGGSHKPAIEPKAPKSPWNDGGWRQSFPPRPYPGDGLPRRY